MLNLIQPRPVALPRAAGFLFMLLPAVEEHSASDLCSASGVIALRFSLKTLLALPLLAALTYWLVLPVIYSQRYYVISNLHIKGWDLTKMQDGELNEIIPRRVSGTIEYPNGEREDVYTHRHEIDGVTISVQPFGVAFETDSTRWHNEKAIRKVHQEMLAFLKRNPDIGIVRGVKLEVYVYRSDGTTGLRKQQVSFTRFDTYPPG